MATCLPVAVPLACYWLANGGGGLQLKHNIKALQFSTNGLVLGGGTVRLAVDGLIQERCVVISLPLGITRQGLWSEGQCLSAENTNS